MAAKPPRIVNLEERLAHRRDRILDAAKTCFVRTGFDRTTMQDIAKEAEMSSPNIYRYFPSKESLVLGLSERGSQTYAFLIEPLQQPGVGSEALIEVFARYFANFDRDSALLRLELWLNAIRDPAIAEIETRGESISNAWLLQTLQSFASAPNCNHQAILDRINPLLKGMTVSRALEAEYDPGPSLSYIKSIIDEGLAGRLEGSVTDKQGGSS
jgi:AcrR family transcriptional regulator